METSNAAARTPSVGERYVRCDIQGRQRKLNKPTFVTARGSLARHSMMYRTSPVRLYPKSWRLPTSDGSAQGSLGDGCVPRTCDHQRLAHNLRHWEQDRQEYQGLLQREIRNQPNVLPKQPVPRVSLRGTCSTFLCFGDGAWKLLVRANTCPA